MTFRNESLLIYKWVKDYLKSNGNIEYNELRSLISVNHGSSRSSAEILLQNLKFAKVIELKKEGEKVLVCLSQKKTTT